MKKAVPFLSLILGVVLLVVAIIAITCFPGSDKGQFTRMAKMLPEDLGGLTFVDVHTLQTDDSLASTWDWVQNQLIGADIYGENVSKLTGFGITVSNDSLRIYEGDFDFTQMTSIIEQGSLESFEYKGITVWTDQNESSIAVIDNVLFVGSSEDVQLCIDVAKGQGTSLYGNKDAKDTIGRLPGGYVLGVALMGSENSSVDSYGVLVSGMAASKKGGNISQTWLYKFQDSDTAQGYITDFGSQIPSDYDVTRDGEYLKIVATSKQPEPNEEAYNNAYSQIQNAVMAYATNNSGVFPTTNGTVNISGSDYNIIDICSLLKSEGGMLSKVPDGVASINGSDNDNCDAGCGGCLDTNHYIWAVDDSDGYVPSICVGANCSEYNADGYQDVWP